MLESFKELFSSTISTAAQRVKNPALGAFVLSWCSFNWKSILYLLFSETKILDKIDYISNASSWKSIIGYPIISVIVICGFLPWANNLIFHWQIRPLNNADSIQNFRKAMEIKRATKLRRLQAKQDVTYEMVRTGAEKDIQKMKEEITLSQSRMGELSAERDQLQNELSSLQNSKDEALKRINLLELDNNKLAKIIEGQKEQIVKLGDINTELTRRLNEMAQASIPGPSRKRLFNPKVSENED